MGIALDHRFAKKLSPRDIFYRIGLFSVYSIFTYYFHFFPFNWLSIDSLIIFFYDLFTDENFKKKAREFNFENQEKIKKSQERLSETILKQTIRAPLTIAECLPYIAGIKFCYFSYQYLFNYCVYDKTNGNSKFFFNSTLCDLTYLLLPNRNAQYDTTSDEQNFFKKQHNLVP